MARRAHRPARSRSCDCSRAGCRTRDRRAARDLAQDRGQPRRAHLHEDRRVQPRASQPVRPEARLDDRRLAVPLDDVVNAEEFAAA